MPVINLDRVVEVSSEDPEQCATNLLSRDILKPWTIKAPGEHQAHVVLQLSSPSQVCSLEIGNHGSAFIEVLVKLSTESEADFEVLLSVSSFMVPSEAKSLSNINRVRLFPKQNLSPDTVAKKWDQIKIICTQPFNKEVKYGLAFVVLNAPEDTTEDADDNQEQAMKLGAFSLKRSGSDDESGAGPSTLIKKSLSSDESGPSNNLRKKEKRETLTSLATTSSKKPRGEPAKVAIKEQAKTSKPKLTRAKPKTSPKVDFSKLMSKVVFVISGIENPERRRLRDKALAMGATYKPDWNSGCTHLVCAFPNTPKYNQVSKAKGCIVAKKWVEDCYTKRKLLPWQKYKLGSYDHGSDTEEEEDEEEEEEEYEQDEEEGDERRGAMADQNGGSKEVDSGSKLLYGQGGTSVKMVASSQMGYAIVDSDDEDPYIKEQSQPVSQKSERESAADNQETADDEPIYDAETDSDHIDVEELSKRDIPPLPRFFGGKQFHLLGPFDEAERKEIKRAIVAYGGEIKRNLTKDVTHVISKSDWNEEFDQALELNDGMLFITPKWLKVCCEKQKLVPFHSYIIPPEED